MCVGMKHRGLALKSAVCLYPQNTSMLAHTPASHGATTEQVQGGIAHLQSLKPTPTATPVKIRLHTAPPNLAHQQQIQHALAAPLYTGNNQTCKPHYSPTCPCAPTTDPARVCNPPQQPPSCLVLSGTLLCWTRSMGSHHPAPLHVSKRSAHPCSMCMRAGTPLM